MTRPVGARIISICELLEHYGPMNRRQVFDLMSGVEMDNMRTYCTRAAGLRLVSINRSAKPAVLQVIPGWQDRLGGAVYTAQKLEPRPTPALKLKPLPKAKARPMRVVSSVWQLGAMA